MPLKATCPHCKTAYTLDDRVAGKKARCRRCKKSFVVSLGPEAGKGTRSAVGMSSLPNGIPVEIEAIFEVR